MRKSLHALAILTLLLAASAIMGSGCKKKVTTAPPPPPAPAEPARAPAPTPAPTVTLSASPSTIERGQSTTLSWNTSNATQVDISGGIGTVEPSGKRTVSPSESITFSARASGAGGNATAEARVTVTAPPEPPPVTPAISDEMFFSQNVQDAYFDYDSYDIRSDARTALENNARALGQRSGIRVTIEGHCDERGSERYNLALGDRRANAAKEFLVGLGVASDRMDTISYGKERNICSEHSEQCWQNNRRAHFEMRR